MDLENQKLSSPNYPQNYFADGDGCEWLITAPEGHKISLEFKHFNVSKNMGLIEFFIQHNVFYSSYMITLSLSFILYHCLMECVIKLKNYKHWMV